MQRKYALILLLEFVGCVSLAVLAMWQFSMIVSKQMVLRDCQNSLLVVEREIKSAEQILSTVSSPEYQELSARKQGYGISGERRYFVT